MTTTPEDNGRGGGIHIGGSVTGNVQTGSHARAEYRQYGPVSAGPAEPSGAARQLLDAVDELRLALRAAAPGEVPGAAAQAAEAALDEVQGAVPGEGEPDQGRIQRAVFTVTGALGAVTGLAQAVQALREAAAPWF